LTSKKLSVLIIEKEYDERLWEYDNILTPRTSSLLKMIERPSVAFGEFFWEMVTRFRPAFITEELGMRDEEEFYETLTARICKERDVPYYPVDIDEYAKVYLGNTVEEKKEFRDKVLRWLSRLSKKDDDETQTKIEYLTAYGQYLQQEFEEEVKNISITVRESWIVMGIINHAKEVEANELMSIHICSPRHVAGTTELLRSLNVDVKSLKIEKTVPTTPQPMSGRNIAKILESLEIQVAPVIQKEEKKFPNILFFLDTDKHASAFDICLAYDAGFDKVVPYENVGAEEAKTIVQDTIFSRGPKGVKHSCFLIGGSDLTKAENVLQVILESMTPPFETSVIIDPRGAYTTAAAVVAKVEHNAEKVGIPSLQDEKVVILAGTGPVGRVTAKLFAKLGSKVSITSRGQAKAEAIAKEVSEECGFQIEGIQASNQEEVYEGIKDCPVIITTGKAGVELISKETLQKLEGPRLVADINAVPPPGVAGLKPKYDLRKLVADTYGIGALAVGDLKYRLEQEILTDAQTIDKGVFDFNYAFEKARKLLDAERSSFDLSELKSPRLTLSLKGKV
jgi:methylene-tetrahydromethanopterin dehydrogenase